MLDCVDLVYQRDLPRIWYLYESSYVTFTGYSKFLLKYPVKEFCITYIFV